VIVNSKLPLFGSHLNEKSLCISVEQVSILEVAAVHRQLLVVIFLHDPFYSSHITTFVIWAFHQQT